MSETPPRKAWIKRLWWILPVAAAVAVYANTLGADFVWDDFYLIMEDHTIKSFRYLNVLFTSDFFGHQEDDLAYGYYRPVVSLTYALDWAIWHARPFGFHLSNLILHGAATALVLMLLVQLGLSRRWATLGALLFAVHPMHTENVAWISGRTDTTAFVLALCAMVLHLRAEGRRRYFFHVGSTLLFCGALAAKEMSVVLIPWLLIAEVHFRRRSVCGALLSTIPYVAAVALYLVWRFVILDVPVPFQPPDVALWEKLAIAPWTFVRYLSWLLVPVHQSAYVQNPYIAGLTDVRLYLGIAAAAGAFYGLYRLRKGAPDAAAWGLMFLVSLGPILGFASISGPRDMGAAMAERFLYFPSFPFVAFVAVLFERFLPTGARAGRIRLPAAGAAAVLLLFAGATVLRNRVWKNNEVFYRATLEAVPSALIWCNLAVHYIHLGKWTEAEAALAEARKLTSDDYHYLSSKALMAVTRHRYDEAIVLQEKVAAKVERGRAVAYNNLAFLYRTTGDLKRAEAYLQEILDNGAGYADVYFNLAEIYRAAGRPEQTEAAYAEALQRRPDNLQFASAYGGFLVSRGNLKRAAKIFDNQRAFHGDNPGLLNNLGVIYKKMKELDRARSLFSEALERDPTYVKARWNLAAVLRALHQNKDAETELHRILKDAPKSPEAAAAKRQLEGE